MKPYTIPLKLSIAYFIGSKQPIMRFKLPKGKAIYIIDLESDCVENNKVIAKHFNDEYKFLYDTLIKYEGRYIRAVWDYWKNGGSKVFNAWLMQKAGMGSVTCLRNSCTYHTIDNRCAKNLENNCAYNIMSHD